MNLGYLSTLKTVGTLSTKIAIVVGDFVFGGTNAAALAAGTFTRTSGTVVTITALTTTANTHYTVTFEGNSSDGGSTAAQSANTTTAVTLNG